jgi:hypothetical protein
MSQAFFAGERVFLARVPWDKRDERWMHVRRYRAHFKVWKGITREEQERRRAGAVLERHLVWGRDPSPVPHLRLVVDNTRDARPTLSG